MQTGIIMLGQSILCNIVQEEKKTNIVLSPSAQEALKEQKHLVVESVGPRVHDVREGDIIIANGQFLERVWVDKDKVIIQRKDVIAVKRSAENIVDCETQD